MEKTLKIPSFLLPNNKRFGCGPSAISDTSLAKIGSSTLIGTSHRQKPVRDLVGKCQTQLLELYNAPTDYSVVLGNGGASTFWAAATASLVSEQALHSVFGSFGDKFYQTTKAAPFLKPSLVKRGGISQRKFLSSHPDTTAIVSDPASELAVLDQVIPGIDSYCYPHHETSTGVISPLKRLGKDGEMNLVDGTSIAGAMPVDLAQVDAYYFSLQKCFASEGGLWVSICSPGALERAEKIVTTQKNGSSRWIPEILDLHLAAKNSAKQQTFNTPAIATLELLSYQLDNLESWGGLLAAEKRCRQSSKLLYDWAINHPDAYPYVHYESERSPVVVTINFRDIDADKLIALLRANQILDVNPYRALGCNQIRISCFPTITPEDIAQLIACMDYLIAHANLEKSA